MYAGNPLRVERPRIFSGPRQEGERRPVRPTNRWADAQETYGQYARMLAFGSANAQRLPLSGFGVPSTVAARDATLPGGTLTSWPPIGKQPRELPPLRIRVPSPDPERLPVAARAVANRELHQLLQTIRLTRQDTKWVQSIFSYGCAGTSQIMGPPPTIVDAWSIKSGHIGVLPWSPLAHVWPWVGPGIHDYLERDIASREEAQRPRPISRSVWEARRRALEEEALRHHPHWGAPLLDLDYTGGPPLELPQWDAIMHEAHEQWERAARAQAEFEREMLRSNPIAVAMLQEDLARLRTLQQQFAQMEEDLPWSGMPEWQQQMWREGLIEWRAWAQQYERHLVEILE
jgi:hypothetical protein